MLKEEIKNLFNGKNSNRVSFLIDEKISKMLNAKTQNVFISAHDIKSHKNKNANPNITYIDYFYACKALRKNNIIKSFKDGDYHTILLGEYENIYRIVLKITKDKKEIFMPSVVKITDLKNEIEKLKRNKQEIL